MTPFGSRHRALSITVKKAERLLVVGFEDGARFELPAELLRVESPSAEVQGHSPSERKLVAGRRKLVFDDLHDSGLFTWDFLYDLGQRQDQVWADYVARLAAAGLSRDPRR